ncbi:methyltransferase domain-containing protein [Propionibacteriaceae bacterium Y1923]
MRDSYNRIAGAYDRTEWVQRPFLGEARRELLTHARGRVLEVAVGSGHNLLHLPADAEVVGVDVSTAMLARARQRADALGRQVELVEGDAQSLGLPDQDFDTVVCLLALCSIPDQARALQEMWRVLRPGGRLLTLDHIEYTRRPWRGFEARKARPRRLPRAVAAEVGFMIDKHRRRGFGFLESVVAHRPA